MTLQIEAMNTEEKLRVMEALWVDLTKKEEEFLTPDWHNDVLKAREQKIKSGEEQYKNWEDAIKEIRNHLL